MIHSELCIISNFEGESSFYLLFYLCVTVLLNNRLMPKPKLAMNKYLFCMLSLAATLSGYAQERFTVSGTVTDATSNETLIGVNIYVPELKTGTATNEYGFYSISLPAGTYDVELSYVGFSTLTSTIVLDKNIRNNVALVEGGEQLAEVVITEKPRASIKRPEMSVNKLSIETI